MTELVHSRAAVEVLPKFYGAIAVIWVEADEDIVFWNKILKKYRRTGVRFKAAYGKERLTTLAREIENGLCATIVAMDDDYDSIIGTIYESDRVVKTIGYAIENTLYCPLNIARIISDRAAALNVAEIERNVRGVVEAFCSDARLMMLYDIASHKHGCGVRVMGDRCQRFLVSPTSVKLAVSEVNAAIGLVEGRISSDALKEIEESVSIDNRELRMIIRGHFLTNMIINLIKNICKRLGGGGAVGMSLESLFAEAVKGCQSCEVECDDLKEHGRRIVSAIEACAG